MSYFFRETAQPFLSLQEEEGARKRVKTFAASEAEKSRLLPVSKGIGTCRWPDSREAAPAGLAAGGGGGRCAPVSGFADSQTRSAK